MTFTALVPQQIDYLIPHSKFTFAIGAAPDQDDVLLFM